MQLLTVITSCCFIQRAVDLSIIIVRIFVAKSSFNSSTMITSFFTETKAPSLSWWRKWYPLLWWNSSSIYVCSRWCVPFHRSTHETIYPKVIRWYKKNILLFPLKFWACRWKRFWDMVYPISLVSILCKYFTRNGGRCCCCIISATQYAQNKFQRLIYASRNV